MAIVSRKEPPRWAVTTIIPALGGASRINFHSSAVKSAFAVITGLRSLQPRALSARTHRSAWSRWAERPGGLLVPRRVVHEAKLRDVRQLRTEPSPEGRQQGDLRRR